MNLLLDSFWRAAAYCLHPRVILLSLLPLVLMAAGALGLGYFFWDAAVDVGARHRRGLVRRRDAVHLAGRGRRAVRSRQVSRRSWWSCSRRR